MKTPFPKNIEDDLKMKMTLITKVSLKMKMTYVTPCGTAVDTTPNQAALSRASKAEKASRSF